MTEEQDKWLTMREQERAARNREYYEKIAIEMAAKEEKSSGKGKGKGKGKDKKEAKTTPALTTKPAPPSAPKYASATAFMEKHFPNFDGEEYPEAQGALR
jgi:hypothetical protein